MAPLPQRLGWWLAAAALVVPPFVVVPGALDAFRLPQRLLAEWLALASLVPLAWLLPALTAPRTWRSPALVAILPLLLVACASLVTSAHPAHVGDALTDLTIGAAALVGWSLALPAPQLRRLLDIVLVPAAGLALLAVLQLHHLWQLVVFAAPLEEQRLAVTSLAGNPGDLAAFLVLPCLLAQAGIEGARGARRGWRVVVLALCLYALAGTQTLTSLVAVAAGSVVLWAVRLPRRRLLALGVAGAVAGALLVTVVTPLRERFAGALGAVERGEPNTLLSGRLDGWRVALHLLREHPLAGVGLGAYRAEFAAAKLELLRDGVPFFAGHVSPSFASAHDEYLEVGADLGWPGLLALGWGIAVVAWAAWRAAPRLPPADRALAFASLAAAALLALAYFPFRLGPVAFAWIACLAWLLAAAAPEREPAAAEAGAGALLVAAVLTLGLLGASGRAWHRLEASVLVRTVQRQMAALGGAAPPAPLLRFAEAALASAHRRDPAAVEPLAFTGDLLLVSGRLTDAVAAYRTAAAHETRPEVLFNWGLALLRQGDAEQATVQLRRAVALASTFRDQVPAAIQPAVRAAPLLPIPPLVPAAAPPRR